jgi:hypothetical protein
MHYDSHHNAFKAIVKMKEGAQFKFIVQGTYEVSFDYDIAYVCDY